MRWIAVPLFLFIIAAGAVPAFGDQRDQPQDENFVTNAVTSVLDKVNQYSSGEKGILIEDYDKPEAKRPDYMTDALGRKIPEPTIRTAPAKKEEPKGE